jgi:hypothetical protein
MELKDVIIKYFRKDTPYEALSNNEFRLLENVSTKFSLAEKQFRLLAKQGFIWDGATIPRFTWTFFGYYPSGLMLTPSLWHDLIYIKKGNVYNYETLKTEFISRKECDLLFLKHMLRMGVEEKKAIKMYKVIRTFGKFYWFDKTNNWFSKIIKTTNNNDKNI